MRRFLYRCLVALHPPAFRRRFADELLWIFDESRGRDTTRFFCDVLISLVRQWVVRSGIWKAAAGATVSGLMIFGCGYSLQVALASALERGNPGHFEEAQHGELANPTGASNERYDPARTLQLERGSAKEAWPIKQVEMSPQIAALERRVDSGDRHALRNFWKNLIRTGTPLIEGHRSDSSYVTVTFIWRGNANTHSVGVLAPLEKVPGLPDVALHQLPHTDVWYSSWRMRDSLRFTYRFVTNVKPGQNPQRAAIVDPLNPRRMSVQFEGARLPTTWFSIASMPRAPEERWTARRANVPRGKVQVRVLKSKILRSERKVWIYTPPGYSEGANNGYSMLVLFDGFSYLKWVPTPTILDNLIHAGEIPAMIAVLVDNPPASRMSELEFDPEFADFVARELLPWVHRHWNVTDDPRRTILGGYSAGGAAAAYIALRDPGLFGNVLSQSGAFQEGARGVPWEWLAKEYEGSRKVPLKFFIEAGSLENVSKEGPTLLSANRNFVEILREKGYAVTYDEFGGTHEPIQWRDTLAPGLIALAK